MRVGIGFMSVRDGQKTSICEFRRWINRMNVLDVEWSLRLKISGLRNREEAYN